MKLSCSEDYKFDGDYSLKFTYNSTKYGYVGCRSQLNVNWSNCNALQFWVIPDGNNQWTVIQINTSDGVSYEAYLQDYADFTNTTDPLLVTIPFTDFKDKNGDAGNFSSKKAASVESIGLWVNAISDSEQISKDDKRVEGTLYYDGIKAIKTDSEKAIFEKPTITKETVRIHGAKSLMVVGTISGIVSLAALVCAIWFIISGRKKKTVGGEE